MFSPTSIFHFHFSLQLPAEDIDDRVRAIFKVHDGDGVMIFNVSKQHTSYTCTSYIIISNILLIVCHTYLCFSVCVCVFGLEFLSISISETNAIFTHTYTEDNDNGRCIFHDIPPPIRVIRSMASI